jgi:hypothetical protein
VYATSDVIPMSDGFLYRSLPAFTGLLVFMPACSDDPAATDTDDPTDGSSSSTDPVTTQVTTTTSVDDSSTGNDTTEGSTTEEPETGETGVPMCGEDAMCGAAAPEGWFGPLIVARGPVEAELPDCPDEFPNAGPVARDGFIDPGPAVCSCECSPPAMMTCYASVVASQNDNCYGGYYYYGYMGYGYGGGNIYAQVEETCTNIDIDGFARFRVYDFYNPPACTPSQSEEIPPVAWDSTIKTCAISDTPLSCSDGSLCIPAPAAGFEATWCLYQQGDAGCPAGIFNTKQKFYTGAEDDRECSDCTCGSSAQNCSDGNLLLFEGPDCAGEPAGSLPPGNVCEPTIAASVAVQYGNGETSCPVASPPHSTGLAEPTGVLTFCCTG